MSADAAAARDRLVQAVVSLRRKGPLRIDALKHRRPPRESAVLILVGVLDDIEADSSRTGGPAADLDLLLTQRASTLRAHPGQVAFPGGRLDPEDGDPEDPDDIMELPGGPAAAAHVRAALREAQEETGLDPSGIEILGTLPKAPVPVSGHDHDHHHDRVGDCDEDDREESSGLTGSPAQRRDRPHGRQRVGGIDVVLLLNGLSRGAKEERQDGGGGGKRQD